MRLSKKDREGYLLLDNRSAPPASGVVPFLEAATCTCSHCQRQIVRNPARQRARAYCPSCDHYICDQCEVIRRIDGCSTWVSKLEKQARVISNIGII